MKSIQPHSLSAQRGLKNVHHEGTKPTMNSLVVRVPTFAYLGVLGVFVVNVGLGISLQQLGLEWVPDARSPAIYPVHEAGQG